MRVQTECYMCMHIHKCIQAAVTATINYTYIANNVYILLLRLGLCCKSGVEYKQFYEYLKNHPGGHLR